MTDRVRGKVKSFDANRGIGMITQNNGPDLFFYPADIQGQRSDSLNPGSVVEFEVREGEKGLTAKKITLI